MAIGHSRFQKSSPRNGCCWISRATAGFTMVELLIAMVVAGVIATIAFPRFSDMRRGWRLDAAARQLVGDLQRARLEAVKRNEVVWLSPQGSTEYVIEHIGVRGLPQGASFVAGGPDTVKFAPFGPTLTGSATYALQLDEKTIEVEVNASGNARVVRP